MQQGNSRSKLNQQDSLCTRRAARCGGPVQIEWPGETRTFLSVSTYPLCLVPNRGSSVHSCIEMPGGFAI